MSMHVFPSSFSRNPGRHLHCRRQRGAVRHTQGPHAGTRQASPWHKQAQAQPACRHESSTHGHGPEVPLCASLAQLVQDRSNPHARSVRGGGREWESIPSTDHPSLQAPTLYPILRSSHSWEQPLSFLLRHSLMKQLSSSEPSAQSLLLSQSSASGMHFPFLQRKKESLHLFSAAGQRRRQRSV